VLDEYPPDDILVDLEAECVRDLLGNLAAAHAWLRLFISTTAAISSLEGPLGPGRRGRWELYEY
jgi:hypothetical protein